MSKRKSQEEHDAMVGYIANFLVSNDYRTIKADIPGYHAPDAIAATTGKKFVPDVSAHGKRLNFFEIETADTIYDDHASDEWTQFARFADQNNAVFWLVVPRGSRS